MQSLACTGMAGQLHDDHHRQDSVAGLWLARILSASASTVLLQVQTPCAAMFRSIPEALTSSSHHLDSSRNNLSPCAVIGLQGMCCRDFAERNWPQSRVFVELLSRLKICRPQGLAGSIPARGTTICKRCGVLIQLVSFRKNGHPFRNYPFAGADLYGPHSA